MEVRQETPMKELLAGQKRKLLNSTGNLDSKSYPSFVSPERVKEIEDKAIMEKQQPKEEAEQYQEIIHENRYKKASLSHFENDDNETMICYINEWLTKLQSRPAPLILGNPGTGKTHLLYALYHTPEIDRIKAKEFYTSTEMLTSIKEAIQTNYAVEKTDTIKTKDILFIDDIGSERLTDYCAELFYVIFDYRWVYNLPTVLNSNYNLSQLTERMGERIVSRILGLCKPFTLKGVDRRIKVK